MNPASALRVLSLIYIGLAALFLGYLGAVWAFLPSEQIGKLSATFVSVPTTNTLKSIVGTGLLWMTGVCIMFLLNPEHWYRPLLLLVAILLVVRVVELAVDGMYSRMIGYALAHSLVLVAVVVAVKLEPITMKE